MGTIISPPSRWSNYNTGKFSNWPTHTARVRSWNLNSALWLQLVLLTKPSLSSLDKVMLKSRAPKQGWHCATRHVWLKQTEAENKELWSLHFTKALLLSWVKRLSNTSCGKYPWESQESCPTNMCLAEVKVTVSSLGCYVLWKLNDEREWGIKHEVLNSRSSNKILELEEIEM